MTGTTWIWALLAAVLVGCGSAQEIPGLNPNAGENTVVGPSPLITIASTLKPCQLGDHFCTIQANAVSSWCHLEAGKVNVVLMDIGAGTREIAQTAGCGTIVPKLEVHETFGLPLLPSAIAVAEEQAKKAGSKVVVLTNADIMYMNDLVETVSAALEQSGGKPWMMVARRWNINIRTPQNFDNDGRWQYALEAKLVSDKATQMPENQWAIDTFIWTVGFWEGIQIKPLMLGAVVWDNWLLHTAISSGKMVIDASDVLKPVHQNHPFSRTTERHQQIKKANELVGERWFMGNTGKTPFKFNTCDLGVCLARRSQ